MKRLALLLVLLFAAPAEAKVEVAESGSIRAEFEYTPRKDMPPKDLVQRIYENGALIVENFLPDDDFLYPGGIIDESSVKAVDLDGDGRAEVIFDVFTGGAHCCLYSEIYNGRSHFREDWGNIGYALEDFDGDGLPEFATADDRFSGLYTAYAFSQVPLQVRRYDPSGAVDFSRDESVADSVRAEAKKFRRTYRKRRDRRGIINRDLVAAALAANAADQCLLGNCARGYALIRRAVERGDLPRFKHYLGTVRRDLRAFGYDAD